MSSRIHTGARTLLTAVAGAVLASGCASIPATDTAGQAKPTRLADGSRAKLTPGVRVVTRAELESGGANQDLPRALSILVPGLTFTRD
jgi:uncharacterized protein YceK